MKRKTSYDFYLILATAMMLVVISVICLWGMFYFKTAQIHRMEPVAKGIFMDRMNMAVFPFIIILVLMLGICVPKRLLSEVWLSRFAVLLLLAGTGTGLFAGIKAGLLVVMIAALALQLVVLGLAVTGSKNLHFEKKGYWLRLGSSLVHLGLILFVLDLFFYERPGLHLFLFWITTISTTLGMFICFYAETVIRLVVTGRRGCDDSGDY